MRCETASCRVRRTSKTIRYVYVYVIWPSFDIICIHPVIAILLREQYLSDRARRSSCLCVYVCPLPLIRFHFSSKTPLKRSARLSIDHHRGPQSAFLRCRSRLARALFTEEVISKKDIYPGALETERRGLALGIRLQRTEIEERRSLVDYASAARMAEDGGG